MDAIKRYNGTYRGVVIDNRDPQKLRRIKVQVPQVTGTQTTEWIWPSEPANVSTDAPPVGQAVWVSYQGGDPEFPLWVGTFGTNKNKGKKIFIKQLSDSTSLTGLASHVIITPNKDGTKEVDLVASIMALANKVKTLETDWAALHTTFGTKTSTSHTHSSAG